VISYDATSACPGLETLLVGYFALLDEYEDDSAVIEAFASEESDLAPNFAAEVTRVLSVKPSEGALAEFLRFEGRSDYLPTWNGTTNREWLLSAVEIVERTLRAT